MTACASVVDVLALAPNPASLGLDRIRVALGVGTDRARVVRALAIERHRSDVTQVAEACGVSLETADAWLWLDRAPR